MKSFCVLGIMSGTSIDSVDYALCTVSDHGFELLDLWKTDFPRKLQQRLHQAARGETNSYELAQLHHDLGRFYAQGVAHGQPKPQLIGLHGQTVFHNPDHRAPATLQLGEPAYLVEALRVPVVSNFRVADLAAGGQGAPLATMLHVRVFGRRGQSVCVNNLGGISNITSINWTRRANPVVAAFDTGPANILIDLAIRHYTGGKQTMDTDGAWAERGTANPMLLQRWLKHPFFAQPPPKSTGREMFGEPFLARALEDLRRQNLSKFDALATLTELTAASLALNYRLHLRTLPQRVVLTGGGAANPVLVRAIGTHLRQLAPSMEVTTSTVLGWPLTSIEPAAFALLAYLRYRGQPGNLPHTTGARRACLLGQLSEP